VVLTVGLLGPLEVSVGGRPVRLSASRLQTLLAVLAMRAGEAVSVARLANAMWDRDLPADARRTVQTYVARLRGMLGGELVASSPGGYVLCAEPDQVDALRFLRLLDAAAVAGEPSVERARLAEAVALWRGTPFEGVRSTWLEDTEAPCLVEGYLAAVERLADLELAEGRHGGLVACLRELVARYPLRESLWLRLLVVLARCGRQAEALVGYEAVRVRLAEELGADPGVDLQRVHADLLAGRTPEVSEGVRSAAARRQVPRQLPATSGGLTGRQAALATLAGLFGDGADSAGGSVAICVISGMAGVGKTALAVHAAERLAGRVPDGPLYVNLYGATAGLRPLAPLEVLGRFLRALGMDPTAVPADLEEAAAAFRSRVAGRRLLVVLDDAADAAQVAPLLPAAAGCGVLVTSRRVLPALEGAVHLHLDVLDQAEALELLGQLAGWERIAAEPEAAAEVARCCGFLPLALRIAGARLAARPTWPVRALADRLGDAQRRLDELELGEVGMRTSFTVSLEQLRASHRAAAEAFGLLGVLDGPEVGVPVVARLLDVCEDAAERVLERLVDAQLVETPAPGRYQLHDLLRLYARELAGRHLRESERATAVTRVLGFYVATAWQTLDLVRPGDHRLARADDRWRKGGLEFADEQQALGWLEAERANLLAAVEQAAGSPGVPAEIVIQLAQALFGFFRVRSHWDDRVRVNQTALRVARRLGNRSAEAQALNDLGGGYWRQGRYEQALACRHQSLAIFRELGDRLGQAFSLGNFALDYRWQGRYDEALACHKESLALFRELGDRRGLGIGLGDLGLFYERLGRYEEALACHEKSLALFRELGGRDGEADCLNGLGIILRRQGRHAEALVYQQESLAIRRELGDRRGQAVSLRELGETACALDRPDEARAYWLEALAILEPLHTSDADQVCGLLAGLPGDPPRPHGPLAAGG
jgi:DNA-binding SARP family transcriptional activator